MADIRTKAHNNCVACGLSNTQGLRLEFHPLEDGSVSAYFNCGRQYESYAGILHGGVLSMILDEAMTNCLFAHECIAITGGLRVQFRFPVATDQKATVRAWITRSSPPIYELKAEIVQNDQVTTTATGKFMEQPQLLNE
jgi:acyl-coenzyme A thioesterase PaaI-like protein